MATSHNLRRHDLDNLRTALTILVILHHTSIVYGGSGAWAFHSSCFASPSDVLLTFNAVDQSFFMGLFFWVSGRMSAQMLSRAAPLEFVRKKILRLGLPTLVYTLFIAPLTAALARLEWNIDHLWRGLVTYWMGVRGVKGPVWYTALLLLFDSFAAAGEAFLHPRRTMLKDPQESRQWVRIWYRVLSNWGWVAVAAVSFSVRLWYPVGATFRPLNIQPAYLPQYIFAYSLGYLSVQQGADRFTGPFDRRTHTSEPTEEVTQPSTSQKISGALPLRVALAISFITLTTCLVPELWARWYNQSYNSPELMKGGWSLSALIYAFWNEFSFVLVGPALMAHFQQWYNLQATSWLWQARYSYAAYLVHPLVSVALETLVDWLMHISGNDFCASDMKWWTIVGPFVFTAVVGLLNATSSFALGKFLITYVPGLRQII